MREAFIRAMAMILRQPEAMFNFLSICSLFFVGGEGPPKVHPQSKFALLSSQFGDVILMCLDVHARVFMGGHTRMDTHSRILSMDIPGYPYVHTWISKHGYPHMDIDNHALRSKHAHACMDIHAWISLHK